MISWNGYKNKLKMNRRSFFGGVVGLIGLPQIVKKVIPGKKEWEKPKAFKYEGPGNPVAKKKVYEFESLESDWAWERAWKEVMKDVKRNRLMPTLAIIMLFLSTVGTSQVAMLDTLKLMEKELYDHCQLVPEDCGAYKWVRFQRDMWERGSMTDICISPEGKVVNGKCATQALVYNPETGETVRSEFPKDTTVWIPLRIDAERFLNQWALDAREKSKKNE